jgi:hypothetical protein
MGPKVESFRGESSLKLNYISAAGRLLVIARFAVSKNLNPKHREGEEQENVYVTAFMQDKL